MGEPVTPILETTIDIGDDLKLGWADNDGTEWWWKKITGWFEPPPSVSTSEDREGAHGGTRGNLYYRRRTISITGTLANDDPDKVAAACEKLAGILPDGRYAKLQVNHAPLGARWVEVQRGEIRTDWDGLTLAQYQITLIAPDYRRYGEPVSEFTPLPSAEVGGLDDEGGLNDEGGLVAETDSFHLGVVTVTNIGRYETEPLMYVHGNTTGVPGPITISDGTEGRQLVYEGDVDPGDFLLFDNGLSKAVLYNGVGDRRELLTVAQWHTVSGGSSKTFLFGHGGGSTGDGRLEVVVAPAYL